MNKQVTRVAIVAALTIGGLSVAGPVTAHSARDTPNFGSHVSNCAHVMGGFRDEHNPSMMHRTSEDVHSCPQI